ncbi:MULTISPECIES: hypothetical protein [Streptomyces]|uniref:hypothetical protein n=1 Tax=Streptomyces TaxID=1883 RepID=UPI0004CCE740|nr:MULTISPECIES: hypothetical protein [Streptomyces]KOT51134.1 hypothetical protein ADK43_32580 [Streptomyces rimosus subsp. rimosus]
MDHLESAANNPLLNKVYMPCGSLLYFGFNGGGPASDRQKNYLRTLLLEHAGDPTAEAIRTYMNALREDHESVISVSHVLPAINYLKCLGRK